MWYSIKVNNERVLKITAKDKKELIYITEEIKTFWQVENIEIKKLGKSRDWDVYDY